MPLDNVTVRLKSETFYRALGRLMAYDVNGVVAEIRPTQPREGSDGSIEFYVREEFAEEVSTELQREFGAVVA